MDRSDRRTFLANTLRVGAATASAGALAGILTDPRAAASADEASGPSAPRRLRVNGLASPIGVDPDDLFFAYVTVDGRRGARQRAYRLVVTRPGGQGVFDSGPVNSRRQAFLAYEGPTLAADTTYQFQVASADAAGRFGALSSPSTFTTGLRTADWRAQWLRPGPPGVVAEEYAYVRQRFTPRASPIVRATAYVAAAHKYQLWVNGRQLDTGPAFSYPDESYYQATDVTAQLAAGRANAWGVLHHWYSSGSGRPLSQPGLLAELRVHHADGTVESFVSDESWRELPGEWQPAPQRNNESGEFVEIIDARQSPLGWSEPSYDDRGWRPPNVLGPVGTEPFSALYALRTRIEEHAQAPVSVTRLDSGATVFDFGKVYAARPVVDFTEGVAGRTVAMHVGYLLDPDGHVSTTHGTQATDLSFAFTQRLGRQTFDPYTFLGFRYLEIDNPGETIRAGQVRAMARHAAMPADAAGAEFASSSGALDAVWALCAHSALYASHEQFVDTPTRQKGQFTCDATNESQAIMHAFGDQNMSWQGLRDFARSQARYWPDGRVNDAYPDGNGAEDIPDFTELFPEWVWRYYLGTGDQATLRALFSVMERISDYIVAAVDPSTGLVTNLPGGSPDYTGGLVDWPPQMRYGYDMGTTARTTVNLLGANAFNRVAEMAAVLGDRAAATLNQSRAQALTTAINAHLLGSDGVYVDGLEADATPSTHRSQQANALALTYGLVPPEARSTVTAHVAHLGIAVGPDHGMELLRGLHQAGLDAHIVALLSDPQGPGWANILARGGTFTWEDWDPSDLAGDSMSHGWGSAALVAILEAFLGVTFTQPGDDGAATVLVSPPNGGLDHAAGMVPTTAGPVQVRWRRVRGHLALELDLPANSSAELRLPGAPGAIVEGGSPIRGRPGITVLSAPPAGPTRLALGAGHYRIGSTA